MTDQQEIKKWADLANDLHRKIRVSAIQMLNDAMRAGDLLNQIKGKLPHGEFQEWVSENFIGGLSTQRVYCRIARNRLKLKPLMAKGTKLTLARALTHLRERPEEKTEDTGTNSEAETKQSGSLTPQQRKKERAIATSMARQQLKAYFNADLKRWPNYLARSFAEDGADKFEELLRDLREAAHAHYQSKKKKKGRDRQKAA